MTKAESVKEAVQKLVESPKRKFVETIELAVNLQNVDLNKPQNRLDEDVVLPNAFKKEIKLAVFSKGELALKAERAGAFPIPPEEVTRMGKDKKASRKMVNSYDFFAAESSIMPLIGKNLGPVLGPRGKMPTPISQDADISAMLGRLQKTVKMKSKDKSTFHIPVGKRDMKTEEIIENTEEVIKKLEGKLERGMQNVKSIYIKTSMGKPVRIA
jgi:large subunit ribosomal protein L1